MGFSKQERLVVFVLLAILAGVLLFRGGLPEEGTGRVVTVWIAGAVERPGRLRLRAGTREREAAAAAAPLPDADTGALGAEEPLHDGDLVYVPRRGEEEAEIEAARERILKRLRRPAPLVPIDANTASKEELLSVPGIGEKLAEAIVAERRREPFRRPRDLTRVSGIGKKTYRTLAGYLTVAPPGRVTEGKGKGDRWR